MFGEGRATAVKRPSSNMPVDDFDLFDRQCHENLSKKMSDFQLSGEQLLISQGSICFF
jgi:hypothetical protein